MAVCKKCQTEREIRDEAEGICQHCKYELKEAKYHENRDLHLQEKQKRFTSK